MTTLAEVAQCIPPEEWDAIVEELQTKFQPTYDPRGESIAALVLWSVREVAKLRAEVKEQSELIERMRERLEL